MRIVGTFSLVVSACGLREAVTLPEETTEPQATVDCTQQPVDQCETFTGCTTVFGRLLRQGQFGAGACYDPEEPLEPVACRYANADCGFALSFSRGPDDLLWWFPDECIPDDHVLFTDANPGDCN